MAVSFSAASDSAHSMVLMTKLEQLQQTGIGRLGTPAHGFKYKRVDGTRIGATDLKRIKELRNQD